MNKNMRKIKYLKIIAMEQFKANNISGSESVYVESWISTCLSPMSNLGEFLFDIDK